MGEWSNERCSESSEVSVHLEGCFDLGYFSFNGLRSLGLGDDVATFSDSDLLAIL